jgi:hypothetical protein
MKIDKEALQETLHDVFLGLLIAFPVGFMSLSICRMLELNTLTTSFIQTSIFLLISIIRKYYIRLLYKNK